MHTYHHLELKTKSYISVARISHKGAQMSASSMATGGGCQATTNSKGKK